jgi:Ni/Co efflux regulator RcnB
MKKILVAILAVSLLSLPAMASNDDGGKKKARKKAKTEVKKDNSCDPKNCDPKNCDPKNCDPKNCDPKNCQYPSSAKDEKCSEASKCTSNK